jgi:hypothetical protein
MFWFTWAADGRHVLFARKAAEEGFELWKLPIDGGEPELLGSLSGSPGPDDSHLLVSHLTAGPDGKRIAFSRAQLGGWVMENPPLPTK